MESKPPLMREPLALLPITSRDRRAVTGPLFSIPYFHLPMRVSAFFFHYSNSLYPPFCIHDSSALQNYELKDGFVVSRGPENQKSCNECQVSLSTYLCPISNDQRNFFPLWLEPFALISWLGKAISYAWWPDNQNVSYLNSLSWCIFCHGALLTGHSDVFWSGICVLLYRRYSDAQRAIETILGCPSGVSIYDSPLHSTYCRHYSNPARWSLLYLNSTATCQLEPLVKEPHQWQLELKLDLDAATNEWTKSRGSHDLLGWRGFLAVPITSALDSSFSLL